MIAVKVEIEDKDDTYKKLLESISENDASHVDIGVHPISGDELLVIASANEFGAWAGKDKKVEIPERSYIRSTVDENRSTYGKIVTNLLNKVLEGKNTIHQSLSLVGLKVESDIKTKIRELRDPPNAESTIKKKKSDNPLIDTGMLVGSIRYAVKSEKEEVLEID